MASEKRKENDRENNLYLKSRNAAQMITKGLRALTRLSLIVGVAITLPLNLIVSDKTLSNIILQFPRFFVPTALFLMLILGVANQYYGTTLNGWLNTLEINIEKKIYGFLYSLTK